MLYLVKKSAHKWAHAVQTGIVQGSPAHEPGVTGRWRECRERQAKGTVPCPGARQWVAGDMWARSLKHGRQEPGLGRRSTSRDAGFTMDPVWI